MARLMVYNYQIHPRKTTFFAARDGRHVVLDSSHCPSFGEPVCYLPIISTPAPPKAYCITAARAAPTMTMFFLGN